jgi:SAM-dependent methyltransferase
MSPGGSERDVDAYFDGRKLYGDDFNLAEIEAWYDDEREAYANLGAKNVRTYAYAYHALNLRHGFRHIPARRYCRALGFGSAYGEEFRPISGLIQRITIVDPSDAFVTDSVYGVPVTYIKPRVDGTLPFPDSDFDLILCLSVLHHIANVSHVIRELCRCLQPRGFAIIREPVVSMGDWRKPRRGLTRRERGVPLEVFRRIIRGAGFDVLRETLCVFNPIPRLWSLFGKPAYNNMLATRLDAVICKLLRWNLKYHSESLLRKFRPTAVCYVLTKREP